MRMHLIWKTGEKCLQWTRYGIYGNGRCFYASSSKVACDLGIAIWNMGNCLDA
jgi:hypothetical protein